MVIDPSLPFGTPLRTTEGTKVFFLYTLDDGSVSCLVGDKSNYGFSILEPDEIESLWFTEDQCDKLAKEYSREPHGYNLGVYTDFKAGLKAAMSILYELHP